MVELAEDLSQVVAVLSSLTELIRKFYIYIFFRIKNKVTKIFSKGRGCVGEGVVEGEEGVQRG